MTVNKTKFLLREIKDYYRFFRKNTEKEIVFYSEHGGYYPNFEGLVNELIDKHNKNICYITSSPKDPILKNTNPKINVFYLNKLLIFFMMFVDCKVFVMTMADLNQFHIKRSFKPVHYVYVPHSLASTNAGDRYGALDHYDSILCGDSHRVKELRKHEEINGLPPKKLVKAGYYRLERIYLAYQTYLSENKLSSEKKTVLVAPSWGADGILESCGERLVEMLLNGGYKVIVRPHPETVKRFPNLMLLFDSKFGNNPNFTLELSVATDDSLLKADVLISDWSGVVFDYAFGTERPVLFLDVPPKIRNPRFKEVGIEPLESFVRSKVGVVVSPKNLEDVPKEISKLIKNKEDYKMAIRELRGECVFAFGESSKVGAEYIMNLLK